MFCPEWYVDVLVKGLNDFCSTKQANTDVSLYSLPNIYMEKKTETTYFQYTKDKAGIVDG